MKNIVLASLLGFGLISSAWATETVNIHERVNNAQAPAHRKRAARTVLTGMCYSVGSATRQGSSSLTRFIGQSAMTLRT